MELKLQSKALKCSLVLDPGAFVGLIVPNGLAKVGVRVSLPSGRTLTAEVNAKSLRRTVAAIEAAGPASVAVVLQGRLEGEAVLEAGIAAQPKAPKATMAA